MPPPVAPWPTATQAPLDGQETAQKLKAEGTLTTFP